jgi:hypothetical protein
MGGEAFRGETRRVLVEGISLAWSPLAVLTCQWTDGDSLHLTVTSYARVDCSKAPDAKQTFAGMLASFQHENFDLELAALLIVNRKDGCGSGRQLRTSMTLSCEL